MGYTLGQVRGYLGAIAGQEQERLLLASTAARMAGADNKAWDRWVRQLSGA